MLTPRRGAPLALVAALLASPLAAQADLGEFSWTGREGSGRLVWNLDTPDSDPAADSASFVNGLVSFDFWASQWASPGDSIQLQGTGGSYTSSWTHLPPEVCYVGNDPCDTAEMTFRLGAPVAGDPTEYTLHVSMLFALDDGRLPIPLPSRGEDYRWLGISMSNNVDDRWWLVFDTRSSGDTRQIATPVPEPATWGLFGLGALLVGAARRRRHAPRA